MRTIVCFRTPGGEYAVPVEHVTEVRSADGMLPLPAPRPGVAGLIHRGDEALPVLAALGSTDGHIVVVDDGTISFGLLVLEVTGVRRVDEAAIGVAPTGQDRAVIAGVIAGPGDPVMLLDVAQLAGRLV